MKTLFLDIETFPTLAAVWGLFKENITIDRVIQPGHTACWSAKWKGEDAIYFDSVHRNSVEGMIENIHALLEEADTVVSYNGQKFDLPVLSREFVLQKLPPPAPYKQVDLYRTVRKNFRFASNKLDFVAQMLGLGKKVKHRGYDLWKGCMDGDKQCWKEMEEYNIQDVVLLEKLYDHLLPWIHNHPNHALFSEEEEQPVCTNCGGHHLQRRGLSRTVTGVYQRYQCKDCGTWMRSRTADKGQSRPVLVKDNG